MRFTEASRLALFAAVELAAAGGRPVSVGELARRHGASPDHLRKVLRALADRGIVRSVRGRGGGFALARRPGEVRLLDVVEPFERRRPPRRAGGGGGPAERLEGVLAEIDEAAFLVLGTVRLSALLREG